MADQHASRDPVPAGAPLDSAPVAAVALHGRGQSPQDMLGLVARVGLPDVAWLLPAAEGGAWYPERYTAPLERNEPWLTSALRAVDRAVARAAAGDGRGLGHVALVGFSQGACLAAEALARAPRRLGALAVLTGALVGPPAPRAPTPGTLDGMSVLLGTVERDEWVALEDTRAAAAFFAAAGARVDLRVFPGAEHGIRDEEVTALRDLLRALHPHG